MSVWRSRACCPGPEGREARALGPVQGCCSGGRGTGSSGEVPGPWNNSSPGWRQEQGGITHREAKFAELAGTEGTATVCTQSTTQGLPLWLKGSLAQGLQLFPLFLRSLFGG